MLRKLILLLLCALLPLSACASPKQPSMGLEVPVDQLTFSSSELVDGYIFIIDLLASDSDGLGGSISYIGVDTSTMANLSREDKDKVLKAVGKYDRAVLDDTVQGFLDKGYCKDMVMHEGIVFTLRDHPPKDGVVTIDAQRFQSRLAGRSWTFDLKQTDGVWKIVRQYNGLAS